MDLYCRDPISLILGTRFSLILGTRSQFSLILETRIGSLKRIKKTLPLYCFLSVVMTIAVLLRLATYK